MSSTHSALDAAATERKARLAKLKSLKRKQPATPSDHANAQNLAEPFTSSTKDAIASPSPVTTTYLSGRNYDPVSRGPKLGFEVSPSGGKETLEDQAAQIAEETHQQAQAEEKEEQPLDLFKLQPKKPNWDLKRDVAHKMEILNSRTDNAIARLVRERIERAKDKTHIWNGGDAAEEVGMKGEELVEGVREREREGEEERRGIEEDDLI
ncbi:MAG: hypothetical protein LQ351_001419 [Letrouitia transgressa]|nr:MAG: hypothetical protein LQ351_001419 [Letrouitia transgressa]